MSLTTDGGPAEAGDADANQIPMMTPTAKKPARPAKSPRKAVRRGKVILSERKKDAPLQKLSSMTGAEFRQRLLDHGVTQQQFARQTGVIPSTVRRWCAGAKIPRWVDLIFELYQVKPSVTYREMGTRGPA